VDAGDDYNSITNWQKTSSPFLATVPAFSFNRECLERLHGSSVRSRPLRMQGSSVVEQLYGSSRILVAAAFSNNHPINWRMPVELHHH
jgi:hypothetical protein